MNTNTKLAEIASELEAEAKLKSDLAARIREMVGDSKKPTFSLEGLKRLRESAKAQWHDCPQACGVKHRMTHPHMKKSPTKVGKVA